MRRLAVKLHDKAVPLVVTVPESARPARLRERHLAVGRGQPVGAFHIAVVAEFEH
jgi:hypothetical protein